MKEKYLKSMRQYVSGPQLTELTCHCCPGLVVAEIDSARAENSCGNKVLRHRNFWLKPTYNMRTYVMKMSRQMEKTVTQMGTRESRMKRGETHPGRHPDAPGDAPARGGTPRGRGGAGARQVRSRGAKEANRVQIKVQLPPYFKPH